MSVGGWIMRIKPLTLKQANELVSTLHRHHKPVRGHRFSIGLEHDGKIIGAAVVGRPVARMTPAYSVAEVSRLVTDGTPNACSKLYGAVARITCEMGFDRVQTFILFSETGISLRAAGWTKDERYSGGGDWNRPSRGGRRRDQPEDPKTLWFKEFVHA